MLFNYGRPHPAPGAAARAARSMWLRSALLSFPAPSAGRSRQRPLEAPSPCGSPSSGPRERSSSSPESRPGWAARAAHLEGVGSGEEVWKPPFPADGLCLEFTLIFFQKCPSFSGLFFWRLCLSGRMLDHPLLFPATTTTTSKPSKKPRLAFQVFC